VSNDTSRDLVVDAGKGRRVLFEAKTAVGTQSIYTGVGQLMLHGAVTPEPSRVLVIAQSPKGDTAKRLARLGIEVLTYDLDGTTARFPGLPALLKRLGLEE
jgi:hypothetical protein